MGSKSSSNGEKYLYRRINPNLREYQKISFTETIQSDAIQISIQKDCRFCYVVLILIVTVLHIFLKIKFGFIFDDIFLSSETTNKMLFV